MNMTIEEKNYYGHLFTEEMEEKKRMQEKAERKQKTKPSSMRQSPKKRR